MGLVHKIRPNQIVPSIRAQSFEKDINKIKYSENRPLWKRFGRSRNSFKASNNFNAPTSFNIQNYTSSKNHSRLSLPDTFSDNSDVEITDETDLSKKRKIFKHFR